MIFRCPHCNMRVVTENNIGDIIHECNSQNPVLDNEDVVRIGAWKDFSGSGATTPQDDMRRGAENELFGTTADIEGNNEEGTTRRGARAPTHRQRQHFEFINLRKDGLD